MMNVSHVQESQVVLMNTRSRIVRGGQLRCAIEVVNQLAQVSTVSERETRAGSSAVRAGDF